MDWTALCTVLCGYYVLVKSSLILLCYYFGLRWVFIEGFGLGLGWFCVSCLV